MAREIVLIYTVVRRVEMSREERGKDDEGVYDALARLTPPEELPEGAVYLLVRDNGSTCQELVTDLLHRLG